MRIKHPVKRVLEDSEGRKVTYLTTSETCRVVGVSATALGNWIEAGAVRFTNRLAGTRSVALVDAALLKKLTVRQSLALGIYRTSAKARRRNREWLQHETDVTLREASYHKERWNEYDLLTVVELVESGSSIESIARELGRTYMSITAVIERLRQNGDLPPTAEPADGSGDDDWLERTRALLTPSERRVLS